MLEPIGLPVLFDGALADEDRNHLHFGEMGLDGETLVTAGYHGWTLVVTGTGDTGMRKITVFPTGHALLAECVKVR